MATASDSLRARQEGLAHAPRHTRRGGGNTRHTGWGREGVTLQIDPIVDLPWWCWWGGGGGYPIGHLLEDARILVGGNLEQGGVGWGGGKGGSRLVW